MEDGMHRVISELSIILSIISRVPLNVFSTCNSLFFSPCSRVQLRSAPSARLLEAELSRSKFVATFDFFANVLEECQSHIKSVQPAISTITQISSVQTETLFVIAN